MEDNELKAAKTAQKLGARAVSELDREQLSQRAVNALTELEALAAELAGQQSPSTYNLWEAVRADCQPLITTIHAYREGRFDGFPTVRLRNELRHLSGALEDLSRADF